MTTLGDLTSDPRNARRHTARNVGMIEASLREVGGARSIVVDEDGVILAGNATCEAAAAAGIERVRIVETDGNEIVAVRRRGLTPEQKTRLALYDNRAAELAEWDESVLGGVDTSGLFELEELAALIEMPEIADIEEPGGSRQLLNQGPSVTVVIPVEKLAVVEAALQQTGCMNRGEALIAICEAYGGQKR